MKPEQRQLYIQDKRMNDLLTMKPCSLYRCYPLSDKFELCVGVHQDFPRRVIGFGRVVRTNVCLRSSKGQSSSRMQCRAKIVCKYTH